MPRKIIVTDFTRFNADDKVCVAGTDMSSGECIRPIPYLSRSACEKLKLLPGAIISGELTPSPTRTEPHTEDCDHGPLKYEGPCTSDQFCWALEKQLAASIDAGFGSVEKKNERCFPIGHRIPRSIVTIRVKPGNVEILPCKFKKENIKINFTDPCGHSYRFFPMTDLGFYKYAISQHKEKKLEELNKFINSQPVIFLRVGLSRTYTSPQGITGHWMQINGVYTFPNFHQGLRGYDPQ